MKLRSALAACALLSLPLLAAAQDSPGQQAIRENKAMIQSRLADLDSERKALVEDNMDLDELEGARFWPIYNSYRTEADKLSLEHLAILMDYASAYNQGAVTDAEARELQKRSLELEEERLELKEKYLKRIAKEVSPRRALRFLQIENRLNAMTVMAISQEVPLAQWSARPARRPLAASPAARRRRGLPRSRPPTTPSPKPWKWPGRWTT